MRRLIFIGLCTLCLVNYTSAQERFTLREQADRLYDRYEYFKSVKLYLKLVKKTKTDVKLLERIADCYKNINHYEEAEQWYAKALADAKASSISHYNYAEVLLRDQKFDLAKQHYGLYYAGAPDKLALKLANCDSAALWMGQKSAYKVTNTEKVNSEFSDWGLNYEGKTGLVFTSDRLADNGVDNRTGNNWFRLYETNISGDEAKIFPLMYGINEYHVGPVAFNNAADTAYITITTNVSKKLLQADSVGKRDKQKLYTRRLELVVATKKDDQWIISGGFPYNDIQHYSVSSATLSPDGRIIYFMSDMPGGIGKTDIWYCEKQAGGKWGAPVNCGKTINTPEEDGFPTIGGDGLLYYSSKGLPGMGGYDMYVSKGEKAQWATPKNLKYPINTTSDDFYLVTRDGKSGYFSSNREGGKGSDDIYSFALQPNDTVPSKLITRSDTSKPKPVMPVKIPQRFVLKTIYYDLDKSAIRPDAALEMDELVLLLKQQPQLKIELSSYTDSRASNQYNMALSQRRAAAAVVYLLERGIPASRVVAKYYGETHLVNMCADNVKCTEEEHQLNRRTEFRVIGD